jgi:uroporphyrinogen-III synthase
LGAVERGADLVVHAGHDVGRQEVLDDHGAVALERGVDLVTFTSASTVRNFVSAVGASSAARVRAVTIGPITSAAASALGINVAVEARAATLDALVDAVLEALA